MLAVRRSALPLVGGSLLSRAYPGLLQQRLLAAGSEAVRASYDVAIAGGGVVGCASAYFLAASGRLPASSICVIERDAKVESGRGGECASCDVE